jgi:hypothetical protein
VLFYVIQFLVVTYEPHQHIHQLFSPLYIHPVVEGKHEKPATDNKGRLVLSDALNDN